MSTFNFKLFNRLNDKGSIYHLTVNAQTHQHEEEDEGKQLRDGHCVEGLWVDDKHQSGTCRRNRRFT